jgi:hypothetical protein
MQRHACSNKLLTPIVNFNSKKNIIFPIFHGHKNTQFNILSYFGKLQILGCYNSTPLKMNLVLEIRKMVTKKMWILLTLNILLFSK